MTIINQIIFHQTCESCTIGENSFFYNLSKDFLLPVLLALLASYMVYWVFVKETKRDKQKEEDVEIQQQKDNLQFFSNIIASSTRTSEQQNEYLKEFVTLLDSDHVNFHLLTFISLNDLRRVTEDLNLEKYLLAYVNYYNGDRKASIKEFNEIITSVDFLHEILKQIPLQLQKAQEFDTERKLKFQRQFEAAFNLTAKIVVDLQSSDVETSEEMSKLGDAFQTSHPGNNYDLEFYYTHFFVPFNDFAISYILSGKPDNLDIKELGILTRDGKQSYLHILSENQTLAKDFKEQNELITSAIIELKKHAKRLTENF